MRPKVIKNETDYESALGRVSALLRAEPGTPAGDELELWNVIIRAYEEEHEPIEPPDPVEAIKFRMEQQGLKAVDLIPYIGAKSHVSEVLSGKRPLSLAMIRKLHAGLGIPADVLMAEKRIVAVAESRTAYKTKRVSR
jgi:HTH-type transcriptional regulator/antitoxin HigA